MKKIALFIMLALGILACKKTTTAPEETVSVIVPVTPVVTYKVRVVAGFRINYINYSAVNNTFNLIDTVNYYINNQNTWAPVLALDFYLHPTFYQITNKVLMIKDTTFDIIESEKHWKATWEVKLKYGQGYDSSFMRIYVNDTLKSSQVSNIGSASLDNNGYNKLYYFH